MQGNKGRRGISLGLYLSKTLRTSYLLLIFGKCSAMKYDIEMADAKTKIVQVFATLSPSKAMLSSECE